MMRRSLYPLLLAVLSAVLMLWAQQAAYTHHLDHIGHIGSAVQETSAPAGDGDHAPLHACVICAVFAGLTAAPPAFVSPIVVTSAAAVPLSHVPAACIPARCALPYTARAPPVFL